MDVRSGESVRHPEPGGTLGLRKESLVLRNIGGAEILIILVVVLLVFGAARLPKLARSLGASAKEFRKGVEEGADDDESSSADESTT